MRKLPALQSIVTAAKAWRRALGLAAMAAAVAAPLMLEAQRGGFGRGRSYYSENPPYDGRFTFTRVRYGSSSWWNHDYPRADLNLPLILREVTAIPINTEASRILDLEDPKIFENPIIYMWEPGYWSITDEGARNLGAYLAKGGFIIFDDFEEDHLYNMTEQFRRAVPAAEWVRLDLTHPIYHSFFDMDGINLPHPDARIGPPAYYGVFEDNDRTKRLVALANHNSDIAEYWEWSGTGAFAVDTTNDAYKLGVNYIIYGLTR